VSKHRIYLLNEQHQYPGERKHGGGSPKHYVHIDWNERGQVLGRSFRSSIQSGEMPHDPTAASHHFLLAWPDLDLEFRSTSKKEGAPPTKRQEVAFSGVQASVFRRLQLDLLGTADGAAVVHVSERNRPALEHMLDHLDSTAHNSRNAAALVSRFAPLPTDVRLHPSLLEEVAGHELADVVLALHPVLSVDEGDSVIAALRRYFRRLGVDHQWRAIGRDLTRTTWARLWVAPDALRSLVEAFSAIRLVHRPLDLRTSARSGRKLVRIPGEEASERAQVPVRWPVSRPPLVAVVDRGIPEQHGLLAPFVSSRLRAPGLDQHHGDHGSMVASRVVFPALDEEPDGDVIPGPHARVVDINVAEHDIDGRVSVQDIVPLMITATTANPDIRVFNLSLGGGASLTTIRTARPDAYQAALRFMQDLDTFAHRYDAVVVTALGNAPAGAVPISAYPQHHVDPAWHAQATGALANAVKVGSTVGERITTYAIAQKHHAPSPFCRVAEAPIGGCTADHGAIGGNLQAGGNANPWDGVPMLDQRGNWTYDSATSFAAPVVARDGAFLLRRLTDLSEDGAIPFAVTVRACLALTADRAPLGDKAHEGLADLTIGFGYPNLDPWFAPPAEHALFVWQGELPGPKERLRVSLPIPGAWLAEAAAPVVRVVWCWDPPVNAAVPDIWACREVDLQLRDAADASLSRKARRKKQRGSTLRSAEYDLSSDALAARKPPIEAPSDGLWTLDIGYTERAEVPDPTVSNIQRVAIAAELVDRRAAASPRPHLDTMALTQTMNRLSTARTGVDVQFTVGR
jgi:hypothetical protein